MDIGMQACSGLLQKLYSGANVHRSNACCAGDGLSSEAETVVDAHVCQAAAFSAATFLAGGQTLQLLSGMRVSYNVAKVLFLAQIVLKLAMQACAA